MVTTKYPLVEVIVVWKGCFKLICLAETFEWRLVATEAKIEVKLWSLYLLRNKEWRARMNG